MSAKYGASEAQKDRIKYFRNKFYKLMKKIVKGNDFTLKIPVMKMVEWQPQAFPLPACTDVVVQVCNQFRRIPLAFTIDVKEDNVLLARVEGDRMGIGTYAIEVKGKIFGNDWRSNEYPQFAIVSKNADADTEFGETDDGDNSVEMDTAMVILPPSVELSDLIDKTNEALKNNKETNDTINENEEARKKEEEARVIAEQNRTGAEQSRVEAEEARVTAEDERTNAETSRVNAESDRVRAEDTRAEIEVTRQSNELTRKDNEVKRVAAESERVKSEEARVADESSRVDAEAQRVSAEAQRVSAENERENAEQDRVAAEDDRMAADTQRETDFAISKKACDDATDKALSTYSHPPHDAAAVLSAAKKSMLAEITAYDSSSSVNSFLLNGMEVWLDKATRVGLMNSTTIAKSMGQEKTTLWLGSYQLEVECDKAIQLLSALEMYALECFNVTAAHKNAVSELDNIDGVLTYDYKSGYPDKLKMEV